MDIFRLGLRNLVGITMPGAVLLLATLYAWAAVAFAFSIPLPAADWVEDKQAITVVIAFLLSYLIGSAMRLNSADRLDCESGAVHKKSYEKKEGRVLSSDEWR